ncbi:MAG TPA: hypothetical protein VL738_41695 [Dactylosporangium sp.]|nr:hypothetical protein [Dactylosporangium sp.]
MTDWSALEHAYTGDPGIPETPQILAALLDEDPAVQNRALYDLHDLVHHQGGLYSATAPAATAVVAMLHDPRTRTPVTPRTGRDAAAVPLTAALLHWLKSVMEAVTEPEEYRRGYPDDVAACRALRPAVYEAARAMRMDPGPAVGAEALGVLSACLLDAAELAQHRAEVARWLSGPDFAPLDLHTRVLAVLNLRSWGYDTTPMMHADPDPLVRAAAATGAPADSPTAARVLLEALSAARWSGWAFPHFGPVYWTEILPAAIDRAAPGDLAPVLAAFLAGRPVIDVGDWRDRLRRKALPELTENVSPPQP